MSAMLTTSELQELINVDRSTIYRMAESGAVPAVKVGRQWRFPASEIEGWLGGLRAERPAPPVTPEARREAELATRLPAAAVQGMIDLVADLFGVMVVLTDMQGRPLSEVANPCGFYAAIAAQPAALDQCVAGWADMAAQPDLQPRFRASQLGFLCAHAFVRVERRLAGMVLAGGLAPADWPPSAAELAAIASRLHVEPRLLADHADEIYAVDAVQRRRILDSLQRVGDVLSRFADERNALIARLGEIATLAAPPDRRSYA